MAYQRGSTRERVSLAEHFKSTILRSVLVKGAGNVAYNVAKGLGFGTLASFGIGQAANLLASAIQAQRSKAPRKTTSRAKGKAGGARRATRGISKAARAVRGATKAGVKEGAKAFRARFGRAAKQAAKEGLKVGTKAFGRRMKELLAT